MKYALLKSEERGKANFGWLKSAHSFSFGNYYDPSRMGFGVLRVINDDKVDAGMGFGMHPHKNMEIVSIPLEGTLIHKDSIGNEEEIKAGEVQIMSAGKGITHSEFNGSKDKSVAFLQIWIEPNQLNGIPSYEKVSLSFKQNVLQNIVAPTSSEGAVKINQNAWFYLGKFEKGFEQEYVLKNKSNGVFIFLIEGKLSIVNEQINERDSLEIEEANKITFRCDSDCTKVLIMEVPLKNKIPN